MKSKFVPYILQNNLGLEDINKTQQDLDFLHHMFKKGSKIEVPSNSKVVLILTRIDDPEVDVVSAKLIENGIYYMRINSEQLLSEYTFSLKYTNGKFEGYIKGFGEKIKLSNIKFIWMRHFHSDSYVYPSNLSNVEKSYIVDNWNRFFKFLYSLDGVEWFNNPKSELINSKPYQLRNAQKAGFNIPETIISNNYSDIKKFKEKNGNIFAKAVHHHFVENPSGKLVNAYGFKVKNISLNKDNLKITPTTFQNIIDGTKEIRAFYINGKIISGLYHDIKNADWHLDGVKNIKVTSVEIPNSVCVAISQLMSVMELKYGAIDLLKSNNKWYFLEVNQTGDWVWMETKTHQDITDAVVNYILNSKSLID